MFQKMKTTTKNIIVHLVGIITSAGISLYAFTSAIFYAWMNANGSWSAEKATPWAYGALAICIIFFILSIYLIIKVIKAINEIQHNKAVKNVR